MEKSYYTLNYKILREENIAEFLQLVEETLDLCIDSYDDNIFLNHAFLDSRIKFKYINNKFVVTDNFDNKYEFDYFDTAVIFSMAWMRISHTTIDWFYERLLDWYYENLGEEN